MALEEQQPLITGYVDLLIKRLTENTKEPQDMVAWYNWTTFDLMGDLAFGEPFGCLEEMYMQVFRRLGLDKYLPYIVPRSLADKRTAFWAYVIAQITKRLETQTGKEGGLSNAEMMTNVSTLVITGSETSATLLAGTTYYLLKNYRVMKKVVEEIRQAFSREEGIDAAGVSRLTYTLAVLNEGMRIFPPVPIAAPRFVNNTEGEVIDGGWVPMNAVVGFYHWAASRSPENFREPDLFIPERWLGDPDFDGDNKQASQPFSIGPRDCLRKNLVYLEMRLILARLLWHFDMELVDNEEDWVDQKVFGFWQKKPLMVLLREAEPKP